ncbi:MAG: hypothetical protein ABSF99_09165 [Anaerolineales bacterium]|jgi:hypothetical protein
MKKWDMLVLDVKKEGKATYSLINLNGTNPEEIRIIEVLIIQEVTKAFSYVNDMGKHKLKIDIQGESLKGYAATIYVSPTSNLVRKDKIFWLDLLYFVRNIVIEGGWSPYPGDGSGTRFIKYRE